MNHSAVTPKKKEKQERSCLLQDRDVVRLHYDGELNSSILPRRKSDKMVHSRFRRNSAGNRFTLQLIRRLLFSRLHGVGSNRRRQPKNSSRHDIFHSKDGVRGGGGGGDDGDGLRSTGERRVRSFSAMRSTSAAYFHGQFLLTAPRLQQEYANFSLTLTSGHATARTTRLNDEDKPE
jgi:hypothetical protein